MNQNNTPKLLLSWASVGRFFGLITVILSSTNTIVFAEVETLEVYIDSNGFELKSSSINERGY